MKPIILKLLYQETITRAEWQDLFWLVHNVCLGKDNSALKLYQSLQEHILDFTPQAQSYVLSVQQDEALLKAYIVEWRKFSTQCSYLLMPFSHLEAAVAGKFPSFKRNGIRKALLERWNQSIFSNIKHRLQNSAMKLVHAERTGEVIDSQLVIGVRESYVSLCLNEDKYEIYRDNFERAYLDATEAYYRAEAPRYLKEYGVLNYMSYANQKLKEEEQRAAKYLELCSTLPFTRCIVDVFVTTFQEVILAECPAMIKNHETEILHLMFKLMDKAPDGISPMLRDLEHYIISEGLAEMKSAAPIITQDCEKYVAQAIELFIRFSKLVKEAFNDDSRFTASRDKAFKQVINDSSIFSLGLTAKQNGAGSKTRSQSHYPEYFSNYCEIVLRKARTRRRLTSKETEQMKVLQMYSDHFEKAYIDATEAFYRAKAPQYLEANGVQNYMRYAEEKLTEEEQRAAKYLESHSVQSLTKSCVSVLVTAFNENILAECPPMVKNNEIEKLQLVFKLMDRVPDGINPMLKYLEQYIVSESLADLMASADIITQDFEKYVEQLLKLFARFSKLVKEAFNDDPRFLTSRDKAFKEVVNDTSVFCLEWSTKQKVIGSRTQPEFRCAELLANYCDVLLRKTSLTKKLTSDEVDKKLKGVLLVLKYVQNKDIFMRYYKSHLTRRLILESSADSEKDKIMVEWLRDVGMPADYVNKLARMFQDVNINKDLNQHFKDLHRNSGSWVGSFNMKILNAGAWARGSERVQVSLPLEFEDFIPEVEEFYRQKHSGRKLQWYHHMSNGTITFSNALGKFDLDVTAFQMAVLFAWNQRPHDRITFENLRLATELSDAELRRTLWSLVSYPKLKRQVVLYFPETKSPKDFDESTVFWVNQEFSLMKNSKPQKRGKVNLIGRLQLSTERSEQEENERIVLLRTLRTQEAIMKIMKMRKQVTNAQLQTELVEILKNMFLPSRKMMKEQIEWLIEHKYIKRDEDDISVFIYVE
ncbi:Cullin-5, partial [Stegodyphus mimosarum]